MKVLSKNKLKLLKEIEDISKGKVPHRRYFMRCNVGRHPYKRSLLTRMVTDRILTVGLAPNGKPAETSVYRIADNVWIDWENSIYEITG